MDYTFADLKKMNVAQLREVAKAEGVEGYTQLNKEHLLEKICHDLHIDMHVHHEIIGVDKAGLKKQIKELKKKRDEAIDAKNKEELKNVRRQIKKLKNKLRQAMV